MPGNKTLFVIMDESKIDDLHKFINEHPGIDLDEFVENAIVIHMTSFHVAKIIHDSVNILQGKKIDNASKKPKSTE